MPFRHGALEGPNVRWGRQNGTFRPCNGMLGWFHGMLGWFHGTLEWLRGALG